MTPSAFEASTSAARIARGDPSSTYSHAAGYIARLLDVMRSAFNDACQVRIRETPSGERIEAALMETAPAIVWRRENLAQELKIPARRPRAQTLSIEQMAAVLDALKTEHLFRFAMMSLCTWARPQAILDFDPATQVDWNDGTIDLAPDEWVTTNKRRARQPLTQSLAGWLERWQQDDAAQRAKDLREGRAPADEALLVYHRARVAVVKRALRRVGHDLGLTGFSQGKFRHFMADQVKKLFLRVPREHRSLWLDRVVRDGSRTTSHYESDDPHMLADVALATDCVMALIGERCERPVFAIETLLNRQDLVLIGARSMPKKLAKSRKNGGRGWDRTSDPYDVNVVLSR
jgi:hypothetical protein